MSARREPMSAKNMKIAILRTRLLLAPMLVVAFFLTATAYGAAPGITGPTFNLTAQSAYITQPDGGMIYSWGYGCDPLNPPSGHAPATISAFFCKSMQVPGPTLIVTEGDPVTVNLTNGLPTSAGNTSILFPGFNVTTTGGVSGLLTQEAAPGSSVTYKFTAGSPGTRAYYSGTQGDLQVEMGLYGAIIVLPAATKVPPICKSGLAAATLAGEANWGEHDFRLAPAAYDHAKTCYDREYLFQFAEMDPNIHNQALSQVQLCDPTLNPVTPPAPCTLHVPT